MGTTVHTGKNFHFYYKIANIQYKKNNGAPFQTRMVLKSGTKTIKDFGWNKANAMKAGKHKTHIVKWYHNAMWYLNLPRKFKPGNYQATIYHKDINSGQTVTIQYSFRVVR